jgi:hypothetical protein
MHVNTENSDIEQGWQIHPTVTEAEKHQIIALNLIEQEIVSEIRHTKRTDSGRLQILPQPTQLRMLPQQFKQPTNLILKAHGQIVPDVVLEIGDEFREVRLED